MDEYEIRAEYLPAAPEPQGELQRGPVNLWHISPIGTATGLCSRELSPTSETIPIESWPTLPPGEASLTEHRRCQACSGAFAALGQPGAQQTQAIDPRDPVRHPRASPFATPTATLWPAM